MSTLTEHFKSVADAIRAKKGTTDLIAPVDFAEEINNLPEGGGNWRYFATTNTNLVRDFPLSSLLKGYVEELGSVQIAPTVTVESEMLPGFVLKAMAYDMNQKIYLTNPEGEALTTVGDVLECMLELTGQEISYLGVEITKEEFYRIPDFSHDGSYIQHIDGTLYTADQWTAKSFNNDEANGIAVISGMENFHCVVAKDSLGKLTWSSMPDTLIEGVSTKTDYNSINYDYNGVGNTALIAAADPNSAAAVCANYTFPNGQKGYLVAFGESFSLNSIDTLLELIGGTPLGDVYIWTSTQYDAEKAWYNRVNGMNDQGGVPKSDNLEVRPVCALENYKFATN